MTKTAEVIKNTLRICANSGVDSCNDCPYRDSGEAACVDSVEADALEYIERLEADNAKLKEWRTAKEVRHGDGSFKCIAYCPMCGEKVGSFGAVKPSYCWNCGQAITFGGQ